ncbi:Crp/Fnr family transcriptional regulator [Mucilaginibacter sp. L3T2-6]|uniref:Crp/Fnr family transcriptional regulator n=1 Tax=Mucilaginibacter sp. L3T2-6 TaxID=3062491 RepID=UPI0026758BC1|nr:Crp/Fnr family transcriptional regulator [Mucilaginibacter sp. L3T2-6]MDO3641849.1 Crp/Fnr family transcriptional regulator [Mucilaginibacter sp. L3T2-6]MDV6214473.1 Crp/Fnr family transcriptional regulator [Mucilaginibacter sp. L3T2-6]
MYEQLKKYLRHNITVDGDILNEIVHSFKPVHFKKNSILLSNGDVCDTFYFVNKGCMRTYYLTLNGSEKTRYIALEGMVITALNSFIAQTPSFEFIDTLDDVEALCISRTAFYGLAKRFSEWRKFYIRLLEFAYIYQNKKIEELVTLSAGERYALLMREHPDYIKRLPNKILASYLDVTQETLSRLKSR